MNTYSDATVVAAQIQATQETLHLALLLLGALVVLIFLVVLNAKKEDPKEGDKKYVPPATKSEGLLERALKRAGKGIAIASRWSVRKVHEQVEESRESRAQLNQARDAKGAVSQHKVFVDVPAEHRGAFTAISSEGKQWDHYDVPTYQRKNVKLAF